MKLMPNISRRRCEKLGLICSEGWPFEWFAAKKAFKQALSNHGQTPERLRERGGLDPCEAVAILKGQSYGDEWPGFSWGRGHEDKKGDTEVALTYLAGYGLKEGLEG